MTITIDELCDRLGITQVIPEEEFRGRQASYDLQAKWYDRKALPSTKAVAPIVGEKLPGVETAVELGAGTGFRVLYYALNNPQTQFLAVDKDRVATDQLKDRIKKLRVRNLRVQTVDMYQLKDKYGAVIAVDCFGGQGHSPSAEEQIRRNFLHLARLVDTSKPGAFFCTPLYGPSHLMMEQEDFMGSIFQEAGLPRLETAPFNFVKLDGTPYSGRVVFGES